MKLSIIIPTLNEQDAIRNTLSNLKRHRPKNIEIIVIDGGSVDQTLALAKPYTDIIINGHPGRAWQMNRGAAIATGDNLLFLHADTRLPENFYANIDHALTTAASIWGYFDITLSGQYRALRVIETMINIRTAITGIASGDQALFVTREAFERLDGFPDIKLMEDIALSRRLKKLAKPARIRHRAITSSRRWQENGITKTVVLMWYLRLAYYCGVDPDRLRRHYK